MFVWDSDLAYMGKVISREQRTRAQEEESSFFSNTHCTHGYSTKAATMFQTLKPTKGGTYREYLDEVELWLCAICHDIQPSKRAIVLLMELTTLDKYGGLRDIVRSRVGLERHPTVSDTQQRRLPPRHQRRSSASTSCPS